MTSGVKETLIILVAVFIGCDDSRDRMSPEPSESLIGNIYNAPPYPTWAVSTAPAFTIGASLQGSDEHQFVDIRYAATLSDGQIVVVVGGASPEIRWFGDDGALNNRAGGRGQGPGELSQTKAGTLLSGDTLVLFDARNQRLSWFNSEGMLTKTRRLDLGLSLDIALQELEPGRLLLAVQSPNHNFGGSEYNYAQDSVFAVLISDDASPPDTILRLPGNEAVTWVDYINGRPRGTRQMELPFGRGTLVGGLGTMVAVIKSDEGELTFFGLGGRADYSAYRSDLEPSPVSSGVRQRYVQSATEQATASGVRPALARAGAEGRINLLPEGRTVPVYDRVLTDPISEQIWLRDFMLPWAVGEPQNWTIYDIRGRVVARVATPAGLDVMQVARDQIVGVSRDDVGVEYVVAHQVHKF